MVGHDLALTLPLAPGSRGQHQRAGLAGLVAGFSRIILCLIRPFLVVGAGFGQVGAVFPSSRHPNPTGAGRQSRRCLRLSVCLRLPCLCGVK